MHSDESYKKVDFNSCSYFQFVFRYLLFRCIGKIGSRCIFDVNKGVLSSFHFVFVFVFVFVFTFVFVFVFAFVSVFVSVFVFVFVFVSYVQGAFSMRPKGCSPLSKGRSFDR